MKNPTCFENHDKPTRIDLTFTSQPWSFQPSCTIDTGLSDFHRITVTVLKTYLKKQWPNIIMYRDYKKFSNQIFRERFVKELSEKNVQVDQFDLFQSTALNILNKQAPVKKKYIRNNQSTFVTKEIRNVVMTRSHLLNKFRKEKTGK